MTFLLSSSTSHQPKTRPARRKRSNVESISAASSDRRKRNTRNSSQVHSENTHSTSQTSSPHSEFIKFLPVESLIKYLTHHYLLNSPIQSNPNPSSSLLKKKEESRLVDHFNRFALLVPSNYDRFNQDHKDKSGLSSTAHKSFMAVEHDQSPSISHSTSIAPASSLPQFPVTASSSESFYEKLFEACSNFLVGIDSHHQKTDSKEKSRSKSSRQNSLMKFDQTLLNLVLHHHHQSFPTMIIEPSSDPISYNKSSPIRNSTNRLNSLPSSPFSSHSSGVNITESANQKTAMPSESHDEEPKQNEKSLKKLAAAHNHEEKLETTTTKKVNSITFDQHGFLFKIHANDPSAHDNHVVNNFTNHQEIPCPDLQLEMIENHVLSNFVYSVKTRGNALRPK